MTIFLRILAAIGAIICFAILLAFTHTWLSEVDSYKDYDFLHNLKEIATLLFVDFACGFAFYKLMGFASDEF